MDEGDYKYKILLTEDDQKDRSLIESQLSKWEIDAQLQCLEQESALIQALQEDLPDLILCNYDLSSFPAIKALSLVRKNHPDLPFIFISNGTPEEKVAEAIRQGASDFAIKSRPKQLLRAIRKALTEQENGQPLHSIHFKTLVKSIDGIVWEADAESFEFTYISPQVEEILGYTPAEWLSEENFWQNHIHHEDREQAVNYCHHKSKQGENHQFEYRMITAEGDVVWIRDLVTVITDEEGESTLLRGFMSDITMIQHAAKLQELENEVLALNSTPNNELIDILSYYINGIEELHPHMIPSILKVEEGKVYHWMASDRLPDRYIEAIDGEAIGPQAGSCGAAAYTKEKVTTSDIKTDPRWEKYKHIALRDGLRACWSQPILDNSDKVIATFALYYKEPKEPSELEEKLIERARSILEIIITHKKNEEALRKLSRKNELILESAGEGIYGIDSEGNCTFINKAASQMLGYEQQACMGENMHELIHSRHEDGSPYPKSECPIFISKNEQKSCEVDDEVFWRSDDSCFNVRYSSYPMIEEREIRGAVVTFTDISEEIQQKQKLQESLERYHYVTKATDDTIYDWDILTDELYWDPGFKSTFIYDEDKGRYTIDDWAENVHPDDLDETRQDLNENLNDPAQSQWEAEYRFARKDGTYATVYERGFIIRNEEGEAIRMIGSLQDITERKKAEKKLRKTEQRLREIVEHSTNMFYKHDTDHVLSYVSPQSKEFLGYSPDEAKKRWTHFLTDHPINKEGVKSTQKAIDTGRAQPPFELQLQKKNGERIWVQVNEAPIVENGETTAIVGSLTDITERKQYEEKLEELSLVASKTTDIIIMTDPNDRITWTNSAFEELTGYTKNEVIGKNPGSLLQGPETDSKTARRLSKAIKNRKHIQETILNYSKDGNKYWLDMTIDPIFDDDGNCTGFIAIEKDVTEQIKRQRKLRESVDRYEKVSKATSDTIWDWDLKKDINRYNSNIYNMFGYEKREVEKVSEWWRDKIHPEDRTEVFKQIDDALAGNTERLQMEYRFQCADGSYKYIYDRAFVVMDEEGNPSRIIGAMQDVTGRIEREQAVRESLKEKETLLAEIHHRVKNNLAVVSSMMQLQAFESQSEDLQQRLYDSVGRIKTMANIHELLYKSQSFSELKLDENIKSLVSGIIETFQANTDITINYNLEPLVLNINQAIPCSLIINEVMTNILKHAFDNGQKGEVSVSISEKEKTVQMIIKDNGKGLPDNFDSLAENSGSLGMKLIHTLSDQLEGEYTYQSSKDGTAFRLTFKKAEIEGIGGTQNVMNTFTL
ncbi:PAS domain S-box protein [Aliifodinibius salicampi]|uniref:histidine kinase n=1 Tax=Fodinibius salicampi TaxID=1920655 RepID=A0ABT3Q179_9BACT|nr:PAS domain S-box protein [Fodinibius salicampi]MCW9713793.1 PAS domain S-box protein [Fodinibius salicampi]